MPSSSHKGASLFDLIFVEYYLKSVLESYLANDYVASLIASMNIIT